MEDLAKKRVKYPFNGVAPNLIDKFLVLGYEQKVIDTTFKYNKSLDDSLINGVIYDIFIFQERPSIINEICNDYKKEWLDNDRVTELIFPNLPMMFFLDKSNIKKSKSQDEELLINTRSIIFSLNPHDNNGSKKSYNGLGYIFYIQQDHNTNDEFDGIMYVPAAYVILSEFPYFYHFNEICKEVYEHMGKVSNEIPIEILLYNIVKYLESPINKSINLTSFTSLNAQLKDKGNNLGKVLYPLYKKKDENQIPNMFFHQLSGYPLMDINLSFLLNILPVNIIIEVFIFSFLEYDIIFYSSKEQNLNMIMYIFSNLNYPFNDTIYYWHILSVSKDSFINGTSPFVGKIGSTLIGISNEYDPDINTTSRIKEHFVLDIDNKNFFFVAENETEESKETILLYNYIKDCISYREKNHQSKKFEEEIKNYPLNNTINLKKEINYLVDELIRRFKIKSENVIYDIKRLPSFVKKYDYESEMECFYSNLCLQKIFYCFIESVFKNFVSELSIEQNIKGDNINLNINIKKNDDNDINEEKQVKKNLTLKAEAIFRKKFLDSSKYYSFFVNFCQYHDTIDLYKIPYTFLNEFIYYSHIAVYNDLSVVDVFNIIDQFYGKSKKIFLEDTSIKAQEADKENIKNKIKK